MTTEQIKAASTAGRACSEEWTALCTHSPDWHRCLLHISEQALPWSWAGGHAASSGNMRPGAWQAVFPDVSQAGAQAGHGMDLA